MRGRLRQIIWSCARLRTLGEAGGWRLAVVFGHRNMFIGVIVIIQPVSDGFTVYSLRMIVAVCLKIAFTTEWP